MTAAGILVFDDVEELDFAGPFEVFGMANRFGASCSLALVAATRDPVRCRYGLRVVPDLTFDDARDLDLLIVPGGLGARTHARNDARVLDFVRAQRGFIASVCTGAIVLAAAGVLDALSATTHHASLELLREFPAIAVIEGARFVMHERVATSAGVSAGIDLALALVERMWGAQISRDVAKNMEWPRSVDNGFGIRRATSADIEPILACLAEAFEPYRTRYTSGGYADTVLTREMLAARMQSMAIFVGVTRAGEVVGTIAARDGHLRGMAVRESSQGRGVARALLEIAEAHLRSEGATRVTLDTTEPLERARAFYAKHGYRATGIVSDFFGMPLHELAKSL
ncbi:MAG TPA: GNAT family N-acetyltransferase [Thermoanaerobaculia bacterium]|nr:GNAT family N-acetyltransferase [Thermoanaerobaculia bacterium]